MAVTTVTNVSRLALRPAGLGSGTWSVPSSPTNVTDCPALTSQHHGCHRARKLVMVHFALRHEAMRLKGQWDTDLLDWIDDKQLWHPDTDSDTDSSDDDEPLVIESETFDT